MDKDQSVEEMAGWFASLMREALDLAAHRLSSRPAARVVFWWSEEISDTRRECIVALRRLQRTGLLNGDDRHSVKNCRIEYRIAKRSLCLKIKQAKIEAWKKLVESIDNDPWGLPYKLVLNKLRYFAPGLTETLSARKVEVLMNTPFLAGPIHDVIEVWWNSRVPLRRCRVSTEEPRQHKYVL